MLVQHQSTRQENRTNRKHLRKPVEFKMLLRPILLHVDKYSEYISDRDTEPSGYVSKCAFSLTKKQTTDKVIIKRNMIFRHYRPQSTSMRKSSKYRKLQVSKISYHCSVNFSPSSSTIPGGGWLD